MSVIRNSDRAGPRRSDHDGIDVFIVASVRLYREGLSQLMAADARFHVSGTAADHEQGMRAMSAMHPAPAVALLDVAGQSGLVSARRLRARLPQVRLVALLTEDSDEHVLAWAATGVVGVVTPESSIEELLTTVACVAGGGAVTSSRATAALLRRVAGAAPRRELPAAQDRLTPREREVLTLIDRGLSNKQIARELHIELATVKNHVHSLLEKLQVDRRGAAAAALREGR